MSTKQEPAPLYDSPSTYFDHTDHQSVSNIFHRDKPGHVVLQIRGDFSRDYAQKLIKLVNGPHPDLAGVEVVSSSAMKAARAAIQRLIDEADSVADGEGFAVLGNLAMEAQEALGLLGRGPQ